MRVMAKKDQRHTLFEKCQITELNGVCRHAALLLEIHESGGEKKLIDCKYNGRNDKAVLEKKNEFDECPHGNLWGDCGACDHASDIAYDTMMENKFHR